MAFESEPKPRFALIKAEPLRGVNKESFESTFLAAASCASRLSEREAVAFSLFNDSFFRQSADSRFLLLMMAIEALLELRPRSDASKLHVEAMIAHTQSAALPSEEKASMIGAIRWLRNESISQAGRHIADERLGTRTYMDMPAPKFFTHCYGMRSALVHGSLPFPTFEQVSRIVGQLESFVSDLLTVPVLGLPNE